jgi:L-asparagine transporter-like permease
VVTIALLLMLTPWSQLGVGESPFVSVLRRLGIPGAAGIMNFVVLSAALSSSNANLYLIARTLFSLARAGFVPARLGEVNHRGAPLRRCLYRASDLAPPCWCAPSGPIRRMCGFLAWRCLARCSCG